VFKMVFLTPYYGLLIISLDHLTISRSNSHMRFFTFLLLLWGLQQTASSCSKSTPVIPGTGDTIVPPVIPPFDINSINDTYGEIASVDQVYQWGSHNVHDPVVIKDGDYFYCYNTDVAFGTDVKPVVFRPKALLISSSRAVPLSTHFGRLM
jgi:hypothetical protein